MFKKCSVFVLLTGLGIISTHAQQPLFLDCPANFEQIFDQSDNDPLFWNAPYYTNPHFPSNDLGEATVNLYQTFSTGCGAIPAINTKLFLDLDGDGIQETYLDSDSLPPTNTIYRNNAELGAFGGTPAAFDFRPVAAEDKYRFTTGVLYLTGDTVVSWIRWENSVGENVPLQLPYGNHRVEFSVTNSCGNQAFCQYDLKISDGAAPVITLLPSLPTAINSTNGLTLYTSDFIQNIKDNYAPEPNIIKGIRLAGTGTGFPLKADGTPYSSVTIACGYPNYYPIEIWAKDFNNNTTVATTNIFVGDNLGICDPFPYYGVVQTELSEGIEDVSILLNTPPHPPVWYNFNQKTIANGQIYTDFGMPSLPENAVAPELDKDPLNGVNTWDLVLISRHILGLDTLGTPYKLISADVNKSGTITTYDIIETRKLILGGIPAFSNNKSWRFVNAAQVFSNPDNPFSEPIQETIKYGDIFNNLSPSIDFIGCKVGDVDNSNTPNNFAGLDERTLQPFFLQIADQEIRAGQEYSISFTAPKSVTGLQFTLNATGLSPRSIVEKQGISKGNFAFFKGDDIHSTITAAFEKEINGFEINFTAISDGRLSDMLEISGDITPALAFDNMGSPYSPTLIFTGNEGQETAFMIAPNPWKTETTIVCTMDKAEDMTLQVSDINGRIILQQKQPAAVGYQEFRIKETDISQAGIYFVTIKTTAGSVTKKIIKS